MDPRGRGQGQFEKDFGFLSGNVYVTSLFSPAERKSVWLCPQRCLGIVTAYQSAWMDATRYNWMTSLRRLVLPQVTALCFTKTQELIIIPKFGSMNESSEWVQWFSLPMPHQQPTNTLIEKEIIHWVSRNVCVLDTFNNFDFTEKRKLAPFYKEHWLYWVLSKVLCIYLYNFNFHYNPIGQVLLLLLLIVVKKKNNIKFTILTISVQSRVLSIFLLLCSRSLELFRLAKL